MKTFVITNLTRHLSHLHPAEHGQFIEGGKGKAAKAKTTQSSEAATNQQLQYEQVKAVTRKITETLQREKVMSCFLVKP